MGAQWHNPGNTTDPARQTKIGRVVHEIPAGFRADGLHDKEKPRSRPPQRMDFRGYPHGLAGVLFPPNSTVRELLLIRALAEEFRKTPGQITTWFSFRLAADQNLVSLQRRTISRTRFGWESRRDYTRPLHPHLSRLWQICSSRRL